MTGRPAPTAISGPQARSSLSVPQAADRLAIPRFAMVSLITEGLIPAHFEGRNLKVRLADVSAYAAHAAPAQAAPLSIAPADAAAEFRAG